MIIFVQIYQNVQNLKLKMSQYPELVRCVESNNYVVVDNVADDPLLKDVRSLLEGAQIQSMALFPIIFESHQI